jgi:nicotinamidase-related amidase
MLRLFRRLLGLIKYSKTERGEARSVPEFRPRSGDIVALGHWCSSGFASTDLDVLLKKDDIHQLIVIGL